MGCTVAHEEPGSTQQEDTDREPEKVALQGKVVTNDRTLGESEVAIGEILRRIILITNQEKKKKKKHQRKDARTTT